MTQLRDSLQVTYYGQQSGQDDAAVCAYGKNFADTLGAEWSTGVQTFVAINRDQYNNSKACGQCIMYRCLLSRGHIQLIMMIIIMMIMQKSLPWPSPSVLEKQFTCCHHDALVQMKASAALLPCSCVSTQQSVQHYGGLAKCAGGQAQVWACSPFQAAGRWAW